MSRLTGSPRKLGVRWEVVVASRGATMPRYRSLLLAFATTLVVSVAPTPFAGDLAYGATITSYSSRASFDAAVGPTTLENFTDQAHFPILSGVLNQFTREAGLSPGDIEAGVTYSTPIGTGNFFNIDLGGGFTGGFLDSVTSEGGDRPLNIAFDSPVAAFGFDTNQSMGDRTRPVLTSKKSRKSLAGTLLLVVYETCA